MNAAAPSRAQSLRRELAIRLSLGILAVWIAALAGAGLVLKARLDRMSDASLQAAADRLLPLAMMEIRAERARRSHEIRRERDDDHEDDEDDDDEGPARRVLEPLPESETLSYVIRGPGGRVMIYSPNAKPEDFPRTQREGFFSTRETRFYVRGAEGGRYAAQVAEPLSLRRRAFWETMALLAAPLALILPASLFGIGWLVRRGLRPVEALSLAVAARGAENLSPLPGNGLKAELEPIRKAVDDLMIRLARALEAERAFAANAAHELRTPIAATLAQTQRLVAESPPGSALRERALGVAGELKRVARLAEKLMQLARAEGGGVVAAAPSDLAPVLEALLEEMGRGAGAERIAAEIAEGEVLSRLDPDAFGVLARNLIENALIHGAPEAPVRVRLSEKGLFTVENDAEPLAPEALSRLATRFERAGARGPGSGLGLAIAASVARALGRDLRLSSPIPGTKRGFRAEIALGV